MRFSVRLGDAEVAGLGAEGLFDVVLASGGSSALLGVLADEGAWSAASAGPYDFSLALAAPGTTGDTLGRDAPSNASRAAHVPGECYSARFHDDGPDVDAWTFNVSAGDLVVYSLAVERDVAGVLQILDADGAVVGAPVGSGGAGQFLASSSGTYTALAASPPLEEDAAYVVAVVVGPDPTGCRPYCLALG